MARSSRVGALGRGRGHRPSGPSSKRTPGAGADDCRVPVKPTGATANHALVGEGVAAGVPKHVRVRLDLKLATGGGALDHPGEAGRRERGRIVPLGLAQIGQSKTTGGTTIFRFPKHAEQTIVLGSSSRIAVGRRRMGVVGTPAAS
jgi:hypothetical protein